MAEGLRLALRQAAPIPLEAELHCAPGEVLALVGPSGSGKTTLLRMVAGLDRPREGRIACNGQTWFDSGARLWVAPQQRRVGLVFQHYALFPHLSAQDNVACALGHLQPALRAERARALLELVNLHGLERRPPHELSGGQQQRVALARALAREPAVLLLDEPFSAVDQVTRRKLRRELVQLRQRLEIPVVLVTHDLDEARMLGDRMCVLHRGHTLQAGVPQDILARPRDALVARLVDIPNIFAGRVAAQRPGDGLTLVEALGRTLEAAHDARFTQGEAVDWMVPADSVILHRRDRPSRGERENPLAGTIAEMTLLGESTTLSLAVEGASESWIALTLPTHVVRRNELAVGAAATVSLLADAIHLMPQEPGRREPPL